MWLPCTEWTKITREQFLERRKTKPPPGFLREFCHCNGEWSVRMSVQQPTTEVWYKDLP